MCLFPKLIRNPKYKPNKKNGGRPPIPKDKRVMMIPVGCQKCMECKKQKGRGWTVRLMEEIRTNKTGEFITLTFSNESIAELSKEIKGLTGYELDNEIATLAVRRFLERWRKKYKVSVKHWLVTELGHNGTENVHLHGILFKNKYKHADTLGGIAKQYQDEQRKDIEKIWGYGWVYIGDYVNEATVNYCVKYSTKMDLKHLEYNARILTSPGIGWNYTNRHDSKLNKYKINGETKETYTYRDGRVCNLPTYYRNKIYSEEEREQLWLQKLDKKVRWVDGVKIDISKNEDDYFGYLKIAQAKNKRLGYGDDEINWERKAYEEQRRKTLHEQRTGTNTRNRKSEGFKRLERLGIYKIDQ